MLRSSDPELPIVERMAGVDWRRLDVDETARFGLALDEYRDALSSHNSRRAAWSTSLGGVLSMVALTLVCIAGKTGGWIALAVILVTQALRAAWLYGLTIRSQRNANAVEAHAVEVLLDLEKKFPAAF